MKKITLFFELILYTFIFGINTVYAYNPLPGCASVEAEFDGEKTISIEVIWSGCDIWTAGIFVYDLKNEEIYKKAPLTGGDGWTHVKKEVVIPENYYGVIKIQVKANIGWGFKDVVGEKELIITNNQVFSDDSSNPDDSIKSNNNYVTDIIRNDEAKVYNLNGKEYIVGYSYWNNGVFTVNGESTFKKTNEDCTANCGGTTIDVGQRHVFSDGSSLTHLGVIEYKGRAKYIVRFKLEAPPQTVKKACQVGWECDGLYRIYVSSDCFKTNKEYCKYGCSAGICLTQTCSVGWKCKDNYNRAYQNNDCTWSNLDYCPMGCANGQCVPEQVVTTSQPTTQNTPTQSEPKSQQTNSVCEAGWICKDSATRAYRSKDCSISSETQCSYGCTNGACKTNPSVGAAITDTTGKIECGLFCWIGRLFTSWWSG